MSDKVFVALYGCDDATVFTLSVTESERELLAKIEAQAQRAGAITQRVRGLVGTSDASLAPTRLAPLVDEVVGLMAPEAESRGCRVAYEPAITFTDQAPPTFDERPPWRLANNLLRRNAEDLRGNPADARYVISGGDGRYTMLVNGDSGTGRKTAGVVEWDGEGNRSSNFTTCELHAPPPYC